MQELIARAKELLADGTVVRVLGWKAGDLPYNPEAAYFETAESLDEMCIRDSCISGGRRLRRCQRFRHRDHYFRNRP